MLSRDPVLSPTPSHLRNLYLPLCSSPEPPAFLRGKCRGLVGSRSTPQLHHVELETYDGGRLSATVDKDHPGTL